MSAYRLTPDAVDDIDAIWSFIAQDSPDAAYDVEQEIAAACDCWLKVRCAVICGAI
jgi:plasmid stabilization system protein ParE